MDVVTYVKLEKYGRPWHNWFIYDPTSPSGLRWKEDRRRGSGRGHVFITAGTPVGTRTHKGYYVVEVDGDSAMTHRIVWEMHNGPLPENTIVDHEDGNTDNNSIDNLIAKTHTGNARNHKMPVTNKTGVCGVHARLGKTRQDREQAVHCHLAQLRQEREHQVFRSQRVRGRPSFSVGYCVPREDAVRIEPSRRRLHIAPRDKRKGTRS